MFEIQVREEIKKKKKKKNTWGYNDWEFSQVRHFKNPQIQKAHRTPRSINIWIQRKHIRAHHKHYWKLKWRENLNDKQKRVKMRGGEGKEGKTKEKKEYHECTCDIVFPISQPDNCSASCLLTSQESKNTQGSHKVTIQFTQLLLNTDSLKVEHQYTLISSSYSNNLRKI